MKKIILCLLLLSAAKCFAQDAGQSFLGNIASRLSFGIRAGANYSNFTNAGFSTDPLAGYNAGITANLKLSEHWSIVEDVLYSTEGAKSTSPDFGKGNVKLSYIDVPIMYRYKSNPGLFFEFGEQAGIKIQEDVLGVTNSNFAKRVNFGAAGGLGYQSPSGLGISLRYIYGLSNIVNPDNLPAGNNFKSANAQASLFYTF